MEKYSKSTLYRLTKEELINYIDILYYNLKTVTEAYNNATNYFCKEVVYNAGVPIKHDANKLDAVRDICGKVIVKISETIVRLYEDETVDKLFIDNELVHILNSILSIDAICRKDKNNE